MIALFPKRFVGVNNGEWNLLVDETSFYLVSFIWFLLKPHTHLQTPGATLCWLTFYSVSAGGGLGALRTIGGLFVPL